MRNLTANDLSLGLRDLVTVRKADLELSGVGKIYAPAIIEREQAFAAASQPEKGRANAAELGEADDLHDGLGNGLWFYTEAILATPGVSDAARAAAQRVRDAFIPARGALGETYAQEAAVARQNRPKIKEREADLMSLPLPDGRTLYDWALGFVDAGESLDALLSERATAEATAAAGRAGAELRVTTIGLLRRFRDALRDELRTNKALPEDLESRVFSYLDELSARRKTKKKPEEPAPTGT